MFLIPILIIAVVVMAHKSAPQGGQSLPSVPAGPPALGAIPNPSPASANGSKWGGRMYRNAKMASFRTLPAEPMTSPSSPQAVARRGVIRPPSQTVDEMQRQILRQGHAPIVNTAKPRRDFQKY